MTDTAAALLLNERQKQCLRLVYENLEAKEIARTLSLSPHTVNEHLRDARRALGVPRSMQAARMLAKAEGDKRLVPKPIGVDRPTDADDDGDGPEVAVPEVHVSGNRYHLSMLRRLGMVVALAIGVIVLGGALLGTTDLVARLLTKYRVDIADGPYKR